ncbi:phosphoenolpyruvate synthase [Nocardioides sp. Root122]|uniref:phosphoenolpyruvate synthase n=1 Tax=Nocardioides TaxID=1839 RepID=UPI000702481B|nr:MULTISPECIES: phosphoenolpyruvate synthase [Nocardioides]KQV69579.1 phosphoenolpyruvate synthase [Nocardioides sp. Root122]MCK9824494.1 phosphoenolpyruvate synthase [Nocardioides cavernae]
METAAYVLDLDHTTIEDVALVGGKNASLGEMHRHLTSAGVRVPHGFAVTAAAYRRVLEATGARARLEEVLDGLDPDDVADLEERAAAARRIVLDADIPDDVREAVSAALGRLHDRYGSDLRLAVRSSATAEDLPEASFAGQHASFLDVGEEELLAAISRCFASLFTARGVHYRHRHGYDHLSVALSVGVMKMVRSDLASSGVAFTVDTETGHPGVVLMSASWGLGENVVQGAVEPDEFYVHKATYRAGHRTVLQRRLGEKAVRMVTTPDGPRNEPTPEADRRRFCLEDADVLELAGASIAIEEHYGRAMDVEWARDGVDGLLYIVQARPETSAVRDATTLKRYVVEDHGVVLAEGRAVGDRVATGRARVVRTSEDLAAFRPGEVLVSETTSPDWEPVLGRAAAVVTDRGGRTCHAAIVARELGLPAVVGTSDATSTLTDGAEVTVVCSEGETGHVYAGAATVRVDRVDLSDLPRPRTRLMVNLGNPDLALRTAMLPSDGVGLARMEFIIGDAIRAHPMALLHPDLVRDADERAAIDALVGPSGDGAAYFVDRLAEGIGMIAAAFHPRPVVVRTSDFKTNEYAGLLGGSWFEPHEENPMLGFRGASRYAHPAYAEGFALECRAIRRVREDMGLTNLVVMLPFVRRLAEADAVLARMAELGLARGADGLQVFAMCEIPNNVVLVDEFAQRFDGLSIGSNDLTQLTLGVDRDSEVVAFDYDEQDPGVMRMIRMAVEGCRRNGIHSGLCGQAPSDYPAMAEFLVEIGIDSMSLNPDSLLRTTRTVVEAEERLGGVLRIPAHAVHADPVHADPVHAD